MFVKVVQGFILLQLPSHRLELVHANDAEESFVDRDLAQLFKFHRRHFVPEVFSADFHDSNLARGHHVEARSVKTPEIGFVADPLACPNPFNGEVTEGLGQHALVEAKTHLLPCGG